MEDPQPGPSSNSPPRKPSFVASKGRFAKFKKRFSLKSISVHGEAASADTAAAEDFVNNDFKKIILSKCSTWMRLVRGLVGRKYQGTVPMGIDILPHRREHQRLPIQYPPR
ncbi:hypothetical protein SK128_001236 [Halocaridina rubra]|uniref:Uncharacterized protein n=1 Tax=Halocaridina rubra TaxID=373956 RepID=A0AAN9AGP6_HALRR